MTEKKKNGSTHNLDFKFKIGKYNLTLRDLRGYSAMGSTLNLAIHDMYDTNKKMNELWAFCDPDIANENWNHSYHGPVSFHNLKDLLIEGNHSWTDFVSVFEKSSDAEDDKSVIKKVFSQFEKGSYPPVWELRNALSALMNTAIAKTPESNAVNEAFKKWLNRRSGVKAAYVAYMEVKNKPVPSEITYLDLSAVVSNWDFKQHLETSRPIVFEIGSLVCLRKNYHGTYRHDPYYYCRTNAFDVPKDQMPRMGIVSEITDRCANRSRYGKGSRLLKVMWSATGETTSISENKLIVAEKYKVGEDT